ncbi:E3 ubiquitin-protein ligase CCNB1IP1 homolog isoform X1 [Brassica napus]|uniref:E3 ubiquitin-protein ligase CCNB1IP1 homolog isoform X1 n=1 Tax=Brassica napus TaxID=3708 RepID=UPI000BBF3191|nr:E3 ubiquitin-protein ligase CCNB1IP1 homolog isoform X1 [Brassica napus]XP_048627150.1 E3 ubiquitin-protein ligase CCNB1IP1 homolog isoform X1 [Brassica napus]XP_048627151.1 E3 ubiquitin-protein ligase CCNB1IP1 homolog isoform X1 [Brassica napus]XP_048627152.1 E3 ubiquitin-protein ligase CCNB1IP1 homolog isoform X1 [Brassica napus]
MLARFSVMMGPVPSVINLMKPVDTNPNEEWVNMAMAGISPQILMKSAYRSVMFYISQRDLEMQYKMNRVVAQCRQKCEGMQAKFNEKIEQVHTAYQKMGTRCQMMEQEVENLTKDKQELQEKFSEKSRQKRKLDGMYDQLRSEYESVKRTAIQPANNFYPRQQEPEFFSNPPFNMMENREPTPKDRSFYSPGIPGSKDEIWPARQNNSNQGPFDISNDLTAIPTDLGNRRAGGGHQTFGSGGNSNPQSTLRNNLGCECTAGETQERCRRIKNAERTSIYTHSQIKLQNKKN